MKINYKKKSVSKLFKIKIIKDYFNYINYMIDMNNLIRHVFIDIFIITNIWSVLDNPTHKVFFSAIVSTYLIKKYI